MFIFVWSRVQSFTDVVLVWCDWFLSCKSHPCIGLHRPSSAENHKDNVSRLLFVFRWGTWFGVPHILSILNLFNVILVCLFIDWTWFVCFYWLNHKSQLDLVICITSQHNLEQLSGRLGLLMVLCRGALLGLVQFALANYPPAARLWLIALLHVGSSRCFFRCICVFLLARPKYLVVPFCDHICSFMTW